MVSWLSYPKCVVIIIVVDNVISPDTKLMKTSEVELTFDIIKEFLYGNPMYLMLLWWERNGFYNCYYVSKHDIYIILTSFGSSISYGLTFWSIFMGYDGYTLPRRVKGFNVTAIQGPLLNININFHYKRDSFNVITYILTEKTLMISQ